MIEPLTNPPDSASVPPACTGRLPRKMVSVPVSDPPGCTVTAESTVAPDRHTCPATASPVLNAPDWQTTGAV